jgi:peptidoglycan/LPS O-acetylase OafA/YrhL
MKYRPDIDGLRAVAVMLVLVFHFHLVPLGDAGFVGVDVFFVISGFLITSIIMQEADQGDFSFARFYLRRIRRLHPPLIAVLGLTAIMAAALALPSQMEELGRETLATLVYGSNIYFWQTINYFGLKVADAPLLHTWSLAVEEQFYLLFPAAFLLIYRRMGPRSLWLVLAAMAASFILNLVMVGIKPQATFYLLPTRAWEMLIGAALAMAARRRPDLMARCGPLGPLGAGLIAASLFIFDGSVQAPGWFAALPTVGAAMLIAAGSDPRAISTRALGWGPAVWVGRISYSLYLVHWPILIAMIWAAEDVGLALNLLGFALSFAAAAAIYAWVETPTRTRRVLGSSRVLLTFFGASSAAMIGLAALAILSGGLPGRFSPEVNALLAYRNDKALRYPHCDSYAGGRLRSCVIGDLSAVPDAMMMGDSHAAAAAGAMDLWLRQERRSAVYSAIGGCLPVLGTGPLGCVAYVDGMVALARKMPRIRQVFIFSSWRQILEDGHVFDGVWRSGPAADAAFADALTRTAEALTAAGASVVLVDPLFALPAPAPEIMARNLAYGLARSMDVDLATHRATFASVYVAFDQVSGPDVRRLSLIDTFCEDGVCRGAWEGAPIFSDNNHLRDGMAPFIAREIARGMGR